jgi:PKD repeat protein
LPGGVATVYISSPAAQEKISSSSFPRAVTIVAYDPEGVANVTLLIKNADGTTTPLNTIDNPGDQTVSLSWATTDPGKYQLIATMKNKRGTVTTSDTITVTVVAEGA